MRRIVFHCTCVCFAGIVAIAFWLGYLSGQDTYKKHGITFSVDNNKSLSVNVGDWRITGDTKFDTWSLEKTVSKKTFPVLTTTTNYDNGYPDSMTIHLLDFPNSRDPVCSVTRDMVSDQVKEIIFGYNPSSRTQQFGTSAYIDEDGDGTFDIWIIFPNGDITQRIVLRLQTSPPYVFPAHPDTELENGSAERNL